MLLFVVNKKLSVADFEWSNETLGNVDSFDSSFKSALRDISEIFNLELNQQNTNYESMKPKKTYDKTNKLW